MDYQGIGLRDFLQFNGHVVLQRVNNNYNLRSFTEKEIELITNGYSTLLGKGAFGAVYKGILDDQHLVAVKKYKDGTRKDAFAKEVTVHSQINHKNVVRLLGCCTEENALTIVMELISNGNLASILHCSTANGHVSFPLDKRLNIAIELAEVVSYMHSMYSPVLHGDIKPDNILLDENLSPKISDFGIARLISSDGAQQTQNIIGSIGYLDPLYCQTGILTSKSDIYSFGVVLVEMITRKKVADDGNLYLIQNFCESLKVGKKIRQMFDEEIMNGKKNMKVLDNIAKLAVECLRLEDKLRPDMVEVADRLRWCRKYLQLNSRGERAGPSATLWSPGGNYLPIQPPSHILIDPTMKKQHTEVHAISLDELNKVTRNFSSDTLIGKGSLARVFVGELKENRKSAVKMLYCPNFEVKELGKEFLSQVQSFSRLEHNNVVQLLSYCIEGNIRALVYEYSSRGSLHDNLHGKKGVVGAQPERALSWAQRVNIALSSAEALEFIHEKAEPCITPRVIKSSDILLFDNDVAKIIGDVGVFESDPDAMIDPRKTYRYHPSTALSCYFAPEYLMTGEFTDKSDIFSFGIVLLELLTGRKAFDHTRPCDQHYLMSWATPRLRKGKVHQCVDPRLGGEYPPKDAAKMAAIASQCLQSKADSRPSMSIVVKDLRVLMQNLSSTPSAGGIVGLV